MSRSFKRMIGVLAVIVVLLASCGRSSNDHCETSDTAGDPPRETISETAESSSESMNEEESLGESTESTVLEEPIVDDNVYIVVGTNEARSGDETVEISVSFRNNPGIFGMDFDVYYDESVLTLTDAISCVDTEGGVFTQPQKYHSPTTFLWDFQDDVWDKDGTFLKLIFNVSETAPRGDYAIEIKYSLGNVFDKEFNAITIRVNNGTLSIVD